MRRFALSLMSGVPVHHHRARFLVKAEIRQEKECRLWKEKMDRANPVDKKKQKDKQKRKELWLESSRPLPPPPHQVVTKRNFMTLRQQKTRGPDDGMTSVAKSQGRGYHGGG